MIAVDTNVLARYLLNDDLEQAKAAARLLAGREFIDVPLSVWLELVWVLQSNDCDKLEIIKGLRHIIGLPSIRPRVLRRPNLRQSKATTNTAWGLAEWHGTL